MSSEFSNKKDKTKKKDGHLEKGLKRKVFTFQLYVAKEISKEYPKNENPQHKCVRR